MKGEDNHNGQTETDSFTDCERCGRDRPANPQRFVVALTDYTDATATDECRFLCGECWGRVLDVTRKGRA